MSLLPDSQLSAFKEDGYLIVRGLFDVEEAGILREAAKAESAFEEKAYDLDDGEGGQQRLVLWNSAGEDLWGAIARSERIVNTMEQLFDDEVYHYHSKMSIKQPPTNAKNNQADKRIGCKPSNILTPPSTPICNPVYTDTRTKIEAPELPAYIAQDRNIPLPRKQFYNLYSHRMLGISHSHLHTIHEKSLVTSAPTFWSCSIPRLPAAWRDLIHSWKEAMVTSGASGL